MRARLLHFVKSCIVDDSDKVVVSNENGISVEAFVELLASHLG